MIAALALVLRHAYSAHALEAQRLDDIPFGKVIFTEKADDTGGFHAVYAVEEGKQLPKMWAFLPSDDTYQSNWGKKQLLLFQLDKSLPLKEKKLTDLDGSEARVYVLPSKCTAYRTIVVGIDENNQRWGVKITKPGTKLEIYGWMSWGGAPVPRRYIISYPSQDEGGLNPMSPCIDLDSTSGTLDEIYGVGVPADQLSDGQKVARRFYPLEIELANGDHKTELNWTSLKPDAPDASVASLRRGVFDYAGQLIDELEKNIDSRPNDLSDGESELLAHLMALGGTTADFKAELARLATPEQRNSFVNKWRSYMVADLHILRDQEQALGASEIAEEDSTRCRMEFAERAKRTQDSWYDAAEHQKQMTEMQSRVDPKKVEGVVPGSSDSMDDLFNK